MKRWVICPVVTVDGSRMPKLSIITDSGRPLAFEEDGITPILRPFLHSSIISSEAWCVSLVKGVDFTNLDKDPEIVPLFEGDDYADTDRRFIEKTLNERGWDTGKLDELKTKLSVKGEDGAGLTLTSSYKEVIHKLGLNLWSGLELSSIHHIWTR